MAQKPPFSIRLDPTLMAKLEADAQRGFRSVSQEIAMRICLSYQDKPTASDQPAERAKHAEAVLRALVDDMTKHYKGGREPAYVDLARAVVAQLPTP